MAFQGFESDRGTLKYRCPAAACDLKCEGRAACLSQYRRRATSGALCVSISSARTGASSPPRPGAPAWRRGYNRRSALERINARLDRSFGFEVHFIRGLAKMKTRMGLALAVMIEGRDERMRSLVRPVPFADRALRQPPTAPTRPLLDAAPLSAARAFLIYPRSALVPTSPQHPNPLPRLQSILPHCQIRSTSPSRQKHPQRRLPMTQQVWRLYLRPHRR